MSSHGASEMDPKHLGYQPPRPLLQRLQNIESQVFTAFERCSLSLPQNQRDNSHGGRINLGKLSYALAMTRKVLADHEEILLVNAVIRKTNEIILTLKSSSFVLSGDIIQRTKWSLVIDQQRLGWKQSSSKDNSSDHLIDRYEPVIQRHEVNQERIKRLLEKGEQVYAQKRTEIKGLQQRVTQAFENDETSNEYQRTPSGVDMDDDESSIQYPKGDDNEEEDEKVDELSYQRRVSSSLQRTKALMSQEMERMSSLANVLGTLHYKLCLPSFLFLILTFNSCRRVRRIS